MFSDELGDTFEGDRSENTPSSGDVDLQGGEICGLVHGFCGSEGIETCKICENGLKTLIMLLKVKASPVKKASNIFSGQSHHHSVMKVR
mmetsp:Transcript_52141/g.52527  ORF Transcript_52141/g.52527 Transcript_52141/m.52527 type:complete len:89 (-) Transcript_52141:201-467(-)